MLKFINKPTLFISNDAYLKMQEYIAQSKKEIGWLGTCSRQNDDYIINNVLDISLDQMQYELEPVYKKMQDNEDAYDNIDEIIE